MMSKLRWLWLGGGLTLLAAGIVMQLRPAVVPATLATNVSSLVTVSDQLFWIIGLLALVFSATIATLGRRSRQTDTLDAISYPDNDPPADNIIGTDVETKLQLLVAGEAASSVASELRADLRDIAVWHLTRRENCSRADAAAALDAGTWTDTTTVAAFFSDDVDQPLWLRVLDWFSYEPRFVRQYRRVAAELTAEPPAEGNT